MNTGQRTNVALALLIGVPALLLWVATCQPPPEPALPPATATATGMTAIITPTHLETRLPLHTATPTETATVEPILAPKSPEATPTSTQAPLTATLIPAPTLQPVQRGGRYVQISAAQDVRADDVSDGGQARASSAFGLSEGGLCGSRIDASSASSGTTGGVDC